MTRFVVIASDDGWILIQRGSMKGTVSFNQDWAAYRDGFGSPHGDDNYWRGLGMIRCLCGERRCRLKVEVDKPFKYEVLALIQSLNLTVNHRCITSRCRISANMGSIFHLNRKRSKLLNIAWECLEWQSQSITINLLSTVHSETRKCKLRKNAQWRAASEAMMLICAGRP